ncbi:MAG: ribosomal RNA small subunit methyltransferase A [Candidatus Aminicenantes bacterium]|nr:ribosomal RNA small subunit methyltransferase A [Candidatus Aminicenantes bacterium]
MKSRSRKSLGQHFLINPDILNKIIDCISPQKQELIIEIGAGKGSLTRLLAEKAGKVIAIEKDESLIPFLEKNKPSNVDIRHEDVLKSAFHQLAEPGITKCVGNLPYSISSQILFKLLNEHQFIKECHFLLQKEVAQRVSASPGSKKYAPISIFLQNVFSIHIQFHLSPGSFVPPPKVKSSLVTLRKRNKLAHDFFQTESFKSFIKQAFSQRRKQLKNNLKHMGWTSEQILTGFKKCGLNPKIRAEKVPMDDFAALYLCLSDQKKEKR